MLLSPFYSEAVAGDLSSRSRDCFPVSENRYVLSLTSSTRYPTSTFHTPSDASLALSRLTHQPRWSFVRGRRDVARTLVYEVVTYRVPSLS